VSDAAITVRRLGKRFRVHRADRPWTLQEAVLGCLRRRCPPVTFWALRDASFTVHRGSSLAVLGRNGSGKSTLLRILGRIIRQDEGWVSVRGRVSGLLDIGAGFHGDLTGRENVFTGSIIAGLTRKETAARFDRIVEFAELEGFIDAPLRCYSTGMHMRLAFSVATHVNPEVLLIDEVLAVGDVGFQKKCIRRLGEMKEAGCTIVIVTHDTGLVPWICDEALWLQDGRVTRQGPAADVCAEYVAHFEKEPAGAAYSAAHAEAVRP
jgi:lipopolysaccharide transport system ATP-binding protein